jgi:DNA-directed RNA polymerase specialized sigma24 family protein
MRRDLLRPVTLDVRDNVLETLVGNHQRFLAFLERRVGSRETAQDILQDGFGRALERADSLRTEESAVAWFYHCSSKRTTTSLRTAIARVRLRFIDVKA